MKKNKDYDNNNKEKPCDIITERKNKIARECLAVFENDLRDNKDINLAEHHENELKKILFHKYGDEFHSRHALHALILSYFCHGIYDSEELTGPFEIDEKKDWKIIADACATMFGKIILEYEQYYYYFGKNDKEEQKNGKEN